MPMISIDWRLVIQSRDLLMWMSDTEAFESRSDAGRWATFRDVCAREFSFDPATDGIRAAADALTEGGGKWDEVWQRFLRCAETLHRCCHRFARGASERPAQPD